MRLFLIKEVIYATSKGQEPQQMPGVINERMPNYGEMLRAAIAQAAQVRAWAMCAN